MDMTVTKRIAYLTAALLAATPAFAADPVLATVKGHGSIACPTLRRFVDVFAVMMNAGDDVDAARLTIAKLGCEALNPGTVVQVLSKNDTLSEIVGSAGKTLIAPGDTLKPSFTR